MNDRKLWTILIIVVTGAFFLLGFFGREVYRQAPPIPGKVVTESGTLLMTKEQILDGQQAWQSIGGQQLGSVLGHGAYQAPDWSADWLHREAMALLESWSQDEHGTPFEELNPEAKATLESRLKVRLRLNRYDKASDTLIVSDERAAAIAKNADYYMKLFGGDESLAALREDYAIHDDAITDPTRLETLTYFFFWTSWACVTERPGETFSYTNNWPHEPLVGNQPTSTNILWSVLSVVLLLAGIGTLAWWYAAKDHQDDEKLVVPKTDPLADVKVTPSMRAVAKYGGVAIALFVVQVLLGALTAHYTVEGDSFFGIPLNEYLPYVVSRTWHVQIAVFWIATAFLATGLFLAPMIGGREPKFQRLGVNVLFGALLLVVSGSLLGELLSVKQVFGLDMGFWFGHQGYEYVDLGRAWQIALYVGLLLWLTLMLRALWPAFGRHGESRGIVALFTVSVVAIGLLYGAGFFYTARSHIAVAEYWRWWVVHLWVEGFFEVFATGVLAFLFAHLGLVKARNAKRAFIASTTIFLIGGIPGTFHHLYFTGTPVSVTAIGAMFSALEVVPLVLIGREALETLRFGRSAPWMQRYRWPLFFFVGVAFWNLVGAGLFGFLINPPIALYYMQGLNTTAVHAHTALFGVYGLLSIGLILLIMRRLGPNREWNTGHLKYSFWALNGGLSLMVLLSLLPIGLAQTWASLDQGLWYARSAEFLQAPLLENLRWMRMVGDVIFMSGVASLAWFMIGLKTGRSYVAVGGADPGPLLRRGTEIKPS